jgi:hypothetical protein
MIILYARVRHFQLDVISDLYYLLFAMIVVFFTAIDAAVRALN